MVIMVDVQASHDDVTKVMTSAWTDGNDWISPTRHGIFGEDYLINESSCQEMALMEISI